MVLFIFLITGYFVLVLGINLKRPLHVDIIRAKANQQLAFVRRNIRTRSSSTKEKLFHTLVRPQLEYAATVWDPHISKQKHSLEMIQRRAARHHNTSSVTDMLHTLGWTSLEHRRATSRLCNSTVTRVTFWSFHDTELNMLFTILLFSNPSCGCC